VPPAGSAPSSTTFTQSGVAEAVVAVAVVVVVVAAVLVVRL
jgi:hypothetical protein